MRSNRSIRVSSRLPSQLVRSAPLLLLTATVGAAFIQSSAIGIASDDVTPPWTTPVLPSPPSEIAPVAPPAVGTSEDVTTPAAAATRTVVDPPRPLSAFTTRGLAWLVAHQHSSGGWGQGDEAPRMRGEPQQRLGHDNIGARPNLGDTCIAALALLRAGNSVKEGDHAVALGRAFEFVFSEVAAADEESLRVGSVQGTRIQGKIGQYVDTFLASLLLAEAKGRFGDPAFEQRGSAALAKVLRKIERNQRQDGQWCDQGWAPVLSQAVAAKALNRAAQNDVRVDQTVLDRVEKSARQTVDKGAMDAPGSAGIALYGGSANLAALQENVVTDAALEAEAQQIMQTSTDDAARAGAKSTLDRIGQTRLACDSIRTSIIDRLNDPAFIAGFGSNGGEEFLSYLNIGESLVIGGGEPWQRWETAMTQNLQRIQNEDGSWTGHHCITGRTFCTATALLVLMTDRMPAPSEPTQAPVAAPIDDAVPAPAASGDAGTVAPVTSGTTPDDC